MKKLGLSLLAVMFVLNCSGCAAFWITAGALAFGPPIVDGIGHGIGQAFADVKKEFVEKSELNAEDGKITLPEIAFNRERFIELTKELQKEMLAQDWKQTKTYTKTEASSCGKKYYEIKLECETDSGTPFELQCKSQDRVNPTFVVTTDSQEPDAKKKVTMEIYSMLEKIVGVCQK